MKKSKLGSTQNNKKKKKNNKKAECKNRKLILQMKTSNFSSKPMKKLRIKNNIVKKQKKNDYIELYKNYNYNFYFKLIIIALIFVKR